MFTNNELEVIQTALGYLNNDMDDFEVLELIADPLRKAGHYHAANFTLDLINKVDNLTAIKPGDTESNPPLNVYNISNGDEVFWSDPDNGNCSKYITIQSIKIVGEIVCIWDSNGEYLECLASELSNPVIKAPDNAESEGEKYRITKKELAALLNSDPCCVLRHDLDPRTDNPATSGGYLKIDWTQARRCYQPDRLDDSEFNMFIEVVESKEARLDGMIVCVNSIDFDFIS